MLESLEQHGARARSVPSALCAVPREGVLGSNQTLQLASLPCSLLGSIRHMPRTASIPAPQLSQGTGLPGAARQ